MTVCRTDMMRVSLRPAAMPHSQISRLEKTGGGRSDVPSSKLTRTQAVSILLLLLRLIPTVTKMLGMPNLPRIEVHWS